MKNTILTFFCVILYATAFSQTIIGDKLSFYNKQVEEDTTCIRCLKDRGHYKFFELNDTIGARSDYFAALKLLNFNQVTSDHFTNFDIIQQIGLTYYFGKWDYESPERQNGMLMEMKILDSLILINPIPYFYEFRAGLKVNMKDYYGAIDDYLNEYKFDKYAYATFRSIADCYSVLGKFNDAIYYYSIDIDSNLLIRQNAINIKDSSIIADNDVTIDVVCNDIATDFYNRAECKMALSDYNGSFVDLNKGIEFINKNYPLVTHRDYKEFLNLELRDIYILIGDIKWNVLDKEGACIAWHKALDYGDWSDIEEKIKMYCEKIKLSREGSVYYISVKIGTITRKFILDTGASEVNISEELERELIFDGAISKTDYLPKGRYQTANGIQECRRVMLKHVSVGPFTISNVIASIGKDETPILLGKSFLDKFKKWSIDNEKSELFLEK